MISRVLLKASRGHIGPTTVQRKAYHRVTRKVAVVAAVEEEAVEEEMEATSHVRRYRSAEAAA